MSRRLEYQYVKEQFEAKGFRLVSQNYINNKTHLEYICRCGKTAFLRFDNLKDVDRCWDCEIKRRFGKTNGNWNPEKSDEERAWDKNKRRGYPGYRKWIVEVFSRERECVICGSKKELVPHHLNSWHWDKQNRLNPDNGVVLCKEHHKQFHKKFGLWNNTFVQFWEWYALQKGNTTSIIEL